MKLATYRDGSRDGQLVVVSRDLSLAHYASGIATRLQQVLDDWNFLSPQLEELSQTLNHGKARHAFAFDPKQCMAPLPRAFQHVGSHAFMGTLERLGSTADAPAGRDAATSPSMYQAGSDDLLAAHDDITLRPGSGIDFGAELAVITGDLAMGSTPDAAIDAIRLVMLGNAMTLHDVSATASDLGAQGIHASPTTSFSPVAATPDELGPAWSGGRVQLDLESTLNGRRFGMVDAAAGMTFHFGQLIAHLCETRNLRAGSIVGSGPVSGADAAHGCSCIAERRAIERHESGASATPFLQAGDTIRIETKGPDGLSVFGAIDQKVVA